MAVLVATFLRPDDLGSLLDSLHALEPPSDASPAVDFPILLVPDAE